MTTQEAPLPVIKSVDTPEVWELKKFTQEEMTATIRTTLYFMGEDQSAMTGWKINLNSGYIRVPHKTDPKVFFLADGVTVMDKKKIFVFAYRECFADSSIVHEVFHAMGREPHYQDDYIELKLVQQKVIWIQCGPGYQLGGPIPPVDAVIKVRQDK